MQACTIGLSIDEDIKLRSRRRSWKGHVYIHAPRSKRTPLTRPYPGYAHQCRNNLGVIGIVKKPIYSSKPVVEYILIALAIYSSFIERLEDRGELFKQKLVVGSKLIVFNTLAAFQYIGIAESLYIRPIINSSYNRAKI